MNNVEKMRSVGRPVGWRKSEGTRAQKQMRAYPDEWDLIQRFARLVKYGDKLACQQFLDQQEQTK